MLNRFAGSKGMSRRIEAFSAQRLVLGNRALAEELALNADIIQVAAGKALIEQDAVDDDIYFIVAGTFSVNVNGRRMAIRGPNDHVGEMAAIQIAQKRSATVVALDDAVVARVHRGSAYKNCK